ncbi:MAG TPA: hypothetical protein VLX29_09665, partial [Nitrospirota bacterium]|nr:hypothetical protein [Nitrospirota bacterium]
MQVAAPIYPFCSSVNIGAATGGTAGVDSIGIGSALGLDLAGNDSADDVGADPGAVDCVAPVNAGVEAGAVAEGAEITVSLLSANEADAS